MPILKRNILQPGLFDNFSDAKLSGYLIVISPPREVEIYVNNLKTEFYRKYGPYESRYSKPHITICNFPLLEERREKVLQGLQEGMFEMNPFILKLNGFGFFKNSNVIYVQVEEPDALKKLREIFHDKIEELRIGKRVFVFDTPHITVAKQVKANIFEEANTEYLSKSYENSFLVDRLTVLRYDLGQRRYFNIGDLNYGGSR